MPNKRSANKLDFRLNPQAREALDTLVTKDAASPAEHMREALRLYFKHLNVNVPVDVYPRGRRKAS